MGFLRSAVKTGLAMKVVNTIRRQASDPENQRKAKDLVRRVRNRGGQQSR